MELKVWVEGIQRIVCGVTVTTTCQDVVFALAHATGKVGRFTLIERWRNNERLLAPNENPLKLLLKWGEYANDVQFILQRSESKQQSQPEAPTGNNNNNARHSSNNSGNNNIVSSDNKHSQANAVMLKKPLGLSNANNTNNNNNNTNNNNNNNYNSSSSSSSNSIECAYSVQQQHQQQNQALQNKTKEMQKSLGAYNVKQNENIGVVKGIPQGSAQTNSPSQQQQKLQPQLPTNSSTICHNARTPADRHSNSSISPQPAPLMPKHEKSHSNPIDMLSSSGGGGQPYAYASHTQHLNVGNDSRNNNIYQQLSAQHSKSINEINLAVVRDSLDRRTSSNINNNNNNSNNNNNNNGNSSEYLVDIYNANAKFNASPDLYKNAPTISANGALVPPPYRDPPPPRNSPLQLQSQRMLQDNVSSSASAVGAPAAGQHANTNYGNDFELEYQNMSSPAAFLEPSEASVSASAVNGDESESIFQATQYNDLLQLIKFQREKISAQQMELSKYDAEIVFLENKERDQAQELEAISREITKADQIFRQGSEQLQILQYVEEENELVKQQEKTLKSEIALLRSKLANCETELLQCKNKIRLLMDDIEVEQRAISKKQKSNRQNVERDFLMEMERIQSEIEQAINNTDTSNKTTENLKKEILLIENAIIEKKRQVEQLVNEMKEVNLQSLTVTTSEEIKHLLESSNKPGSSRRIIGSPRQLENAVPTSKNPHGVWV